MTDPQLSTPDIPEQQPAEEVRPTRSIPSLARGVVWSGIVAEIERDHEARLLRAAQQERDAA
jgi:Family of unknown function (DUF6222)